MKYEKSPHAGKQEGLLSNQKLAIQPVVVCILARKGVLWTLLLP